MSKRRTIRSVARSFTFVLALVAMTGIVACAGGPTDPASDAPGAAMESLEARFDSTGTRWCDHTQSWDC